MVKPILTLAAEWAVFEASLGESVADAEMKTLLRMRLLRRCGRGPALANLSRAGRRQGADRGGDGGADGHDLRGGEAVYRRDGEKARVTTPAVGMPFRSSVISRSASSGESGSTRSVYSAKRPRISREIER